MTELLLLLSILGFIVSIYAFRIQTRSHLRKELCDLRDDVSCTVVLGSEHGRLLGPPNSLFGMVYYAVIFILAYIGQPTPLFYISILGVVASVYLGYIAYVKMKNFCLVCTAIYVINVLMLVSSWPI